MTTRKRAKVDGYIPEAVDGDNDGLVQDGTEFERPVGTEIDIMLEEVKAPLIDAHIVAEGENIQTIAQLYKPEGMTRSEYAKLLHSLNKNWSVGSVIRLG